MTSNKNVKVSLAEGCPDVLKIWDYDNNSVSPQNISVYSKDKVHWICENGHRWEASVLNVVRGSRCPYCSGRIAITGVNDLMTLNPDLAKEWHPSKNGDLKPSDVSPGSSKRVWWLGRCGHEWDAVISARNQGNGCPVCRGLRIIPGINDLATLNPELAKEYSPDNPIPVDRISPYTHKHAIWIFPCGHSYSAEVKTRHLRGDGCKYCHGYAVLSGENDLLSLYPEIAKEWDYGRNKKGPDQVRPKSNLPVYWLCSYCGQSYKMAPCDRLYQGCPICGRESKVSIGEKIIAYYLDKAGFRVKESYRDKEKLGKMELDIFLPELNLGIEYDGRKYHADPTRDYKKNACCKHSGIDLIRFREKGCPVMLGTEFIEVDPNNYNTIVCGVNELLSIINEKYGLATNVEMDLNKDFQEIIEKKYTARKETSLGIKYPMIAKNLHPDVSVKPTAIPFKSNIPFKWVCPDCGYEWTATVYSVVSSYEKFGRTGCPRCAGKVSPGSIC